MTLLMTSNTKSIPAVVDSSVMPDGKNAADPQAQINEWVSELVAGDFYRRIRFYVECALRCVAGGMLLMGESQRKACPME
jgi:hypothetical protein